MQTSHIQKQESPEVKAATQRRGPCTMYSFEHTHDFPEFANFSENNVYRAYEQALDLNGDPVVITIERFSQVAVWQQSWANLPYRSTVLTMFLSKVWPEDTEYDTSTYGTGILEVSAGFPSVASVDAQGRPAMGEGLSSGFDYIYPGTYHLYLIWDPRGVGSGYPSAGWTSTVHTTFIVDECYTDENGIFGLQDGSVDGCGWIPRDFTEVPPVTGVPSVSTEDNFLDITENPSLHGIWGQPSFIEVISEDPLDEESKKWAYVGYQTHIQKIALEDIINGGVDPETGDPLLLPGTEPYATIPSSLFDYFDRLRRPKSKNLDNDWTQSTTDAESIWFFTYPVEPYFEHADSYSPSGDWRDYSRAFPTKVIRFNIESKTFTEVLFWDNPNDRNPSGAPDEWFNDTTVMKGLCYNFSDDKIYFTTDSHAYSIFYPEYFDPETGGTRYGFYEYGTSWVGDQTGLWRMDKDGSNLELVWGLNSDPWEGKDWLEFLDGDQEALTMGCPTVDEDGIIWFSWLGIQYNYNPATDEATWDQAVQWVDGEYNFFFRNDGEVGAYWLDGLSDNDGPKVFAPRNMWVKDSWYVGEAQGKRWAMYGGVDGGGLQAIYARGVADVHGQNLGRYFVTSSGTVALESDSTIGFVRHSLLDGGYQGIKSKWKHVYFLNVHQQANVSANSEYPNGESQAFGSIWGRVDAAPLTKLTWRNTIYAG